jgi:hypothetical protein
VLGLDDWLAFGNDSGACASMCVFSLVEEPSCSSRLAKCCTIWLGLLICDCSQQSQVDNL